MVFLLVFPFSVLFIILFFYFMKKVDADLTLFYYDKQDNIFELLRDKVVWITGASSGLGEYLAYELAKNGCKLTLSGTSEERLERVKQKCKELGVPDEDVFVLPFNMTKFDLHEECVKKVIEKFGKLDVLVNNAGRSQRASFQDIDISVDKELFEVNVFAILNLTRKVLPHFLENKAGHFVVTSSCVGKMGAAMSASYTGSKHAIHGYFEALRTEMTKKNIDVTILCPGPVFSRFLENAFTGTPGEVKSHTLVLSIYSPGKQPAMPVIFVGKAIILCRGMSIFSGMSRCIESIVIKKFGKPTQSSDKRMSTDRCGRLMAVSIAHKLDEAWIAIQPCLLFYYLAQYTPTIFRKIIIGKFYTEDRAAKIREGRW